MHKKRQKLKINCDKCRYKNLCLPRSMLDADVKKLNTIIDEVILLKKGEFIYQKGQEIHNFLAVYAGYCQESWVDIHGNEYVENFYFPGDILGLEHAPLQFYIYSAVALTEVKLCVIPRRELMKFAQQSEKLFYRLFDINSYKMLNNAYIKRTTNARSRVANFLMNMILRYKERQMHSLHIRLPMTRFAISNFLGMAYETVSRIFHDLEHEKIIKISAKEVSIINFSKLKEIASPIENFGQI